MSEVLRGIGFLLCLLAPGMAIGLYMGWRLRARAAQVGCPACLVPTPIYRLAVYIRNSLEEDNANESI